MSPAAEKFVADVRKRVDADLADLIAAELDKGVSLLTLMDYLQTSMAAKRAHDRAVAERS